MKGSSYKVPHPTGTRKEWLMLPYCSIGWAIFLLRQKVFVEIGKDRPYLYDMPTNMWIPPLKGGIRDLRK